MDKPKFITIRGTLFSTKELRYVEIHGFDQKSLKITYRDQSAYKWSFTDWDQAKKAYDEIVEKLVCGPKPEDEPRPVSANDVTVDALCLRVGAEPGSLHFRVMGLYNMTKRYVFDELYTHEDLTRELGEWWDAGLQ